MKRTTASWLLLGGLLAACSGGEEIQAGGGDDTAQATEAAAESTAHEPTLERLMARSQERLDVTCAGEWIEVYDFVHPETREWMSIYQFLEGKDNHAYAEPTEPQVIAREENGKAYLSATVLWTPKHPQLAEVDNVPEGWDPTQRIEWIETWEFSGGDWHLHWPVQHPSDFFQDHPELLKKPEGDDEVAAVEQH